MKKINDSKIKECILSNIKNLNAIFVFPTQICATMWAEKTLEFSGVTCVASERFIAWDDFKGSSIRSQHQEKNSIPSTLRSLFAENLILQNSKKPFLKYIVSEKFANSANRFSSWIANLLPSLLMWKNSFDKRKILPDEEDSDYLEIYKRYKEYLDRNNFFDPAWETPPFRADGNKYIIFFPEVLMDYLEYSDILESSQDITVINIPDNYYDEEKPDGHFYSNSRIELKNVMNYLWDVHKKKNISWDKIAISVPDLDLYGPYLERDLRLYEIPYVLKNGTSLASKGSGIIFSQIQNCYGQDYSYEALKCLLLNKELPWKNPKLNDSLILFGRQNNCLCSYEYKGKKVDVWLESFKNPVDFSHVEILEPYYKELKKSISKIVESKSFSEIRSNYFIFREKFFDFSKGDFSPENDKILSRCISELGSLIDLEEQFGDTGIFELSSHFGFFCNYIKDKKYVPQKQTRGVQVLPYRTASCAPFDVHVIIDASQNSTSVVYKQLSFLRDDKRKLLGFSNDSNISEKFILLYEMNSQVETFFSCSEKTFDAYAFVSSYLVERDHRKETDELLKEDLFTMEKNAYLNINSKRKFNLLYRNQKSGFGKWADCERSENSAEIISDKIKDVFDLKLLNNNKVKVSVSDLRKFFECPRKFLYSRVLDVKQEDSAALLIDRYAMGDLYHLILEIFLKKLLSENLSLIYDESKMGLSDNIKKILIISVKEGINSIKKSHLSRQLFSSSENSILDLMISAVEKLALKLNGYQVYKVEEKYRYTQEDWDYEINLRVDCILKSPDGDLVIIDFKSTKNAFPEVPYWDSEKMIIPDFQLPVYKYVIDKMLKESQKVCGCTFYSIRDAKFNSLYSDLDELYVKDENNELFQITQEKCLSFIEDYVLFIKNQNFDPLSLRVDISSCSGCSYKSVCRKTFTVSPAKD